MEMNNETYGTQSTESTVENQKNFTIIIGAVAVVIVVVTGAFLYLSATRGESREDLTEVLQEPYEYFAPEFAEGVDVSSLTMLSRYYARDENAVYFLHYGDLFGPDSDTVVYTSAIEGVDVASFVTALQFAGKDVSYAKDKFRVYFADTVLPNVDSSSYHFVDDYDADTFSDFETSFSYLSGDEKSLYYFDVQFLELNVDALVIDYLGGPETESIRPNVMLHDDDGLYVVSGSVNPIVPVMQIEGKSFKVGRRYDVFSGMRHYAHLYCATDNEYMYAFLIKTPYYKTLEIFKDPNGTPGKASYFCALAEKTKAEGRRLEINLETNTQ